MLTSAASLKMRVHARHRDAGYPSLYTLKWYVAERVVAGCWQQQQQLLQSQLAPSLPVLPPVIITVLPVAAMTVALRLLGNLARLAADREVDCSMAQGDKQTQQRHNCK
jgi:TRAP-type C4-dicarboxylate transport system permease small subunit